MATRLNSTRAVGRENLAKAMPVAIAKVTTPVNASTVASVLAYRPCGAITPYPIVHIVCTLKKKWSSKVVAFTTESLCSQ